MSVMISDHVSLHHWPVERKPTRMPASAEEMISSLNFPRGFFRIRPLGIVYRFARRLSTCASKLKACRTCLWRRTGPGAPLWPCVWSRKAWRDVKAEGGGGTHAAILRDTPRAVLPPALAVGPTHARCPTSTRAYPTNFRRRSIIVCVLSKT
jgi:hypothetical protein